MTNRRGWPLLFAGLVASPLLVLLILPVVSLAANGTGPALRDAVKSPETWEAVGVSLRTSLVALAVIVLLGTPLGYLLGRGRFWGRGALFGLVSMPAVLPPAAAGIGLLLALGRQGLVGPMLETWGLSLSFSTAAVVIAQVFVASPFFVLQAANAVESLDPMVEECAVLDGANSWIVFGSIIVPQVRASLVSGATTAWARALGEFGATILFAGSLAGVTRTMPLAIYLGFEGDMNVSIALSCVLMALALVAVIFAHGARRLAN